VVMRTRWKVSVVELVALVMAKAQAAAQGKVLDRSEGIQNRHRR